MTGYRSEIETSAGPAREGLLGGGSRLLVTVRLFDANPEDRPAPDAFTNLRPETARDFAFELLAAAEDAERQTKQAGFWEQNR